MTSALATMCKYIGSVAVICLYSLHNSLMIYQYCFSSVVSGRIYACLFSIKKIFTLILFTITYFIETSDFSCNLTFKGYSVCPTKGGLNTISCSLSQAKPIRHFQCPLAKHLVPSNDGQSKSGLCALPSIHTFVKISIWMLNFFYQMMGNYGKVYPAKSYNTLYRYVFILKHIHCLVLFMKICFNFNVSPVKFR